MIIILLVRILSVLLELFIPLLWVFLCIRGTLKWVFSNMRYAMLYAIEYYDEAFTYILNKMLKIFNKKG